MSLLGRRSWSLTAVVVLSMAMCLAISARTAPPVSGADPVVAIDPAAAEVAINGSVDVAIAITDATDLYAASVDVSFNPALLEVVDADPGRSGAQIITGTFPGSSEGPSDVTVNTADNVTGTIEYDVTLLDGSPSVNGSGALATIRFSGKAAGTSAVTLEGAALWDSLNQGIITTSTSGEIEVAEAATDTPAPTSTLTTSTTSTRTPTGTPAETDTPSPTRTPKPTNTPRATATPKSTVTPQPPQERPQPTTSAGESRPPVRSQRRQGARCPPPEQARCRPRCGAGSS